jgi:para-nitrobenzyl esterase
MKNLLAIILATLVILTLVAGCAKSEVEPPVTEPATAAAATTPPPASTLAAITTTPSPTPTTSLQKTVPPPSLADPIETKYGLVAGELITDAGQEIHVYKGIPYATPPVGDLRWKPPQSPTPWNGVRACTEYSLPAPQQNLFGFPEVPQSEDCLYLNVLTPAETAADALPVMVWMHGGGLFQGSGNDADVNLPNLPEHGVVLVTVNMRLNVLGLLAHPLLSEESSDGVSGNYLFLDTIAALEWVRDNITAFGGDPGNVTIFGESGGGIKVAELMASPLAKGLFHRAILESGTAVEGFYSEISLEEQEALGKDIFARLGVDKEADPLAAARALPWEDVVAVLGQTVLNATVDGWFLPDTAFNIFKDGKQNPAPFITVANLGEITGPSFPLFIFPTLITGYTNMLSGASKVGVAGYAAIFEHAPANWKAEGVVPGHGMELPYIFGNMDTATGQWALDSMMAQYAGATQPDPSLTEADQQLSENIMLMWTQFARTGNPSVPGVVEWPAYDAAGDKYLALDVPLKVKSGFSLIAPDEPAPAAATETSPTTGSGEAGEVAACTWEEAKNHVGESVTVTGPIVDTFDLRTIGLGDYITIGMGKPVMDPGTIGINLKVDDAVLPEDLYTGKMISVTGTPYINPLGSISIDVTDLSQIEIIE